MSCLLLVPLIACGDDDDGTGPTPTPVATTVTIDPGTATLTAIGDTIRLAARVRDQNGATMAGADVAWSSLDPDVATVASTGTIAAVNAGQTRIIAKSGAVADTAMVIVSPEAVAMSVAPDTVRLDALGDSARLEPSFRDRNGSTFTDATAAIEWTSLDESVATVSDGWVRSVGVGSTRIAAAAGELVDTVDVVIVQVPAAVSLSTDAATLAEGDTLTIAASVVDSNGHVIPGTDVVWTTSDSTAATVGASGLVTAVWGDATATVTATAADLSASATITVLGKIVFSSERDGHTGIYVMNSDGSGVDSVTISTGVNEHPAWSPDGQWIAFISDRSGGRNIWLTKADGTTALPLTALLGVHAHPSWAPDGTNVVFVSQRAGGQPELWVMNAVDGSDPVRLTFDNRYKAYPAWSPDGTRIAYAARAGAADDYEIWGVNADGSKPVQLADNSVDDVWPRWSPDGSRIVFASERDGNMEIYVMNADGSDPQRLTNNPGTDTTPHWRPRPTSD